MKRTNKSVDRWLEQTSLRGTGLLDKHMRYRFWGLHDSCLAAIVMQVALIALQAKYIVTTLLFNLFDYFLLTPKVGALGDPSHR